MERFAASALLSALTAAAAAQFGPLEQLPGAEPIYSLLSYVQADYNGDGLQDILFVDYSSTVKVALNLGDGTFSNVHALMTTDQPVTEIDAADMEGDGDLDVLVCRGSAQVDSIYWVVNNGPAEPTIRAMFTGGHPEHAIARDIDADGDADIIANLWYGDISSIELSLLVNNGATFAHHPIDGGAARFEVADIDADGALDLVLAQGVNGLWWYRRSGPASFTEQPIILAGVFNGDPRCVDINGDGWIDVLASGHEPDNILILNQGGGASWTVPVQTPLGGHISVAGDMDGDGDLDIITGPMPIRWFENDGSGAMVQMHEVYGATDPYLPEPWEGISTADLDADGDLDIITNYGSPSLHVNNGDGTFAMPVDPRPGTMHYADQTFPIDVDQDGKVDVLSICRGSSIISWSRNDGAGGWEAPTVLTRTAYLPDMATLGDINGDGRADLVVNCTEGTVWYELELPMLGEAHLISDAPNITHSEPQCVDIDGDLDIDIVWQFIDSLLLALNDGTGSFSPAVQPDFDLDDAGSYYLFADLNADGAVDIVRSHFTYSYLLNDGSGSFGAPIELPYRPQFAMDADGDGDIDLFTFNSHFFLLRNNGLGQFEEAEPVQLPTSISNINGSRVIADIDADGDQDLLFVSYDRVFICWMEEGGLASPVEMPDLAPPPGGITYSMALGQFSGSTALELLALYFPGSPMVAANYAESPYQLRGSLFHDLDEDGVRDAGEPPLAWCQVDSDPATVTIATQADGRYILPAHEGSFTLAPTALPGGFWQPTTPSTLSATLTEAAPAVDGLDFGYKAIADSSIIAPQLHEGSAACGTDLSVTLSWRNLGTRTEHGLLALTLDPHYVYSYSITPYDSVSGQTLWWHFDELVPLGLQHLELAVTSPTSDFMGEQVLSTFSVITQDDMDMPIDTFSFEHERVIACAYDPNYKAVMPEGTGVHHAMDIGTEALTYTIHFQNTGSAPAYDVELRDALADGLDPDRITLLAFSHRPTSIQVDQDHELTIRLANIMLPDSLSDPQGSQGFITFRIGIVPGASSPTEITNTADIHFDLNAPVTTNTVWTTLVDCSIWTASITDIGGGMLEASEGEHYQWYLEGQPLPDDTLQVLLATTNGDYAVQVTDGYGCSAMSSPYVVIGTSMPALTAPTFVIVPNPFTTACRLIGNTLFTEDHTVVLIDVNGKAVRTFRGNGRRELLIERDGLPAGLYVVNIHGPGGLTSSARVVME